MVGVGFALSDALTLTLEDQLVRDEDPSGSTTQDLASASLAWMPRKTLQLDVLTSIPEPTTISAITAGLLVFAGARIFRRKARVFSK